METTGKKKIRVAIVNWNGAGGGTERSLRDFAKSADQENFEFRFYFLFTYGLMAEQISAFGYRTEFLGWKHWTTLKGRYDLLTALRHFHPDIIHVHVVSPLTRCLLKWCVPGARLIASEHGPLVEILDNFPAVYPSYILNKMDYWFPERVVVYSRAMAEAVHRHYRKRKGKILLCKLGVDLTRFDPESSGCVEALGNGEQGVFRVGYVGRILNRHKGTDQIPRVAWKILELGTSDFEIIIVGDGPDRDSVEDLSRRLGVLEKITFAGWQDDIPAWMKSFDVLLVPSRFEPFGLVVSEALAMGTRVVASDVGGICEATAGSEDAFLVPPDDFNAMAKAIIDIKGKYGKTRSCASRERIAGMYSSRNMAMEMEKIYRELVGG
jgi:L-malate glycosyltransferase